MPDGEYEEHEAYLERLSADIEPMEEEEEGDWYE